MLKMIGPQKSFVETVSGRRTFDRLVVRERVIDTGERTLAVAEIASMSVGLDDRWPVKLALLGTGALVGLTAFIYPLLAILSLLLIVSTVFLRSVSTLVITTSDGTKTCFTSDRRSQLDEAHAFLAEKINNSDLALTATFVFTPEVAVENTTRADVEMPVPSAPAFSHQPNHQQAPIPSPIASPAQPSQHMNVQAPHADLTYANGGHGPGAITPGAVANSPASTQPHMVPAVDELAHSSGAGEQTQPGQHSPASDQPRQRRRGLLPNVLERPSREDQDLAATAPAAASDDPTHIDYSTVLGQVTELYRFYAQTPDTQHIEERLSEMEVLMRSGTPTEEGRERMRALSSELSTILQVYPTMVQLFQSIAGLTEPQTS